MKRTFMIDLKSLLPLVAPEEPAEEGSNESSAKRASTSFSTRERILWGLGKQASPSQAHQWASSTTLIVPLNLTPISLIISPASSLTTPSLLGQFRDLGESSFEEESEVGRGSQEESLLEKDIVSQTLREDERTARFWMPVYHLG
ncbi:hypothetical protein AMTRI_Chr10g224660 [Amborella trichopoda]